MYWQVQQIHGSGHPAAANAVAAFSVNQQVQQQHHQQIEQQQASTLHCNQAQ
jgi:hypothetical protein